MAKEDGNMKKKLFLLMLTVCMTLGMQNASAEGTAATRGETELLSAPNEAAQVLMNYAHATRVTVLDESEDGFTHVRVGQGRGTIEGYMRENELAYGEGAVRELRPSDYELDISEQVVKVYPTCDGQSAPFMLDNDSLLYFIGENDEWLHAIFYGGETETGFVLKEGLDLSREVIKPQYSISTTPMEGEVTREEAIAYGIERLIADGELANGGEEVVTREKLESCEVHFQVDYDFEYQDGQTPLRYSVTFIDPTLTWRDGTAFMYAFIQMWIDGNQIVDYNYGNG